MPTHNGERFIREALDSLLSQDYPNIEILISDNASTDGTAAIVGGYVARNGRVRVIRQTLTVKAFRNFNLVFQESAGSYFMWAADDDRWHPSYVGMCVAALQADPSAVMATTGLKFIDEAGQDLALDFPYDNPDLSSGSVRTRVRALLQRGGWYQVYGLARRDALDRTSLMRDVYGADVVLTMALALLGPIVKVPDVLFSYRRRSGVTEAARVMRQGGVPNMTRVLQAKYTSLAESLTQTVLDSAVPRRTKAALVAEIICGAYLDDTPLSRHTRSEVPVRLRFAIQDRQVGSIGKFVLLRLATTAARAFRRFRRVSTRRYR